MDIQIRTAQANPRNLQKVRERVDEWISDPEIAETMWYTLPRGKDSIVGPSVRLAEILYNAWGNIRVMSHVVETTATYATALGVAIDLETNTGVSSDATVAIYGRGPDAVKQAKMRAQAVARRNATFQVIPGVFQRQALEKAMRVAKGQDLGVRRKRVLEWFGERGVSESMVYGAVKKKPGDDLTTHDLELLSGMRNKIVDELKSPEQAMRQQADAQEHEEATHDSEPEPSSEESPLTALQIDAQKKFGKHFDAVWDAAEDVAGMDYDMLRCILSAPKTVVVAAATGKDVQAELRQIAKAQAKT